MAVIRLQMCSNPACQGVGEHFHDRQDREFFSQLTDAELEWLKNKARWEHMSISAVAREWGVEREEPAP